MLLRNGPEIPMDNISLSMRTNLESNDRGIWPTGFKGGTKVGGNKKLSLNQEVNGYVWNQRTSLFTF
jgi:hypothetical protein